MFCRKCGKELKDTLTHCTGCGEKVVVLKQKKGHTLPIERHNPTATEMWKRASEKSKLVFVGVVGAAIMLIITAIAVTAIISSADRSSDEAEGFTEEKRMQIFYDLVEYQDRGGPGYDPERDTKAYEVIAERYDTTEDLVREIGMEGIRKDWPMP